MKQIAIICLLLASIHARGDGAKDGAHDGLVIVESEQFSGLKQDTTLTVKIKGNKARLDSTGGTLPCGGVIGDLDSGDVVMLSPSDKTFLKFPGKEWRAEEEQVKKTFPDAATPSPTPGKPPEIVDTGKQEKVAGYDTEIYTYEDPKRKTKATFWISKEAPHYEIVQAFLRKMQLAMKGMIPEAPDTTLIDGMVVKEESVSEINGKASTLTITLVSVKEEPVADSEFQIPDGYKITGILGE